MIKKEYEYYREHQDELARKYENKVVLIREEKVVEVYDTYRQAELDLYKKHQYETYFLQKCIKRSSEYPKLLAIGWLRVMHGTREDEEKGTLVYLLEDEEMFYGYTQNPKYYRFVKPSHNALLALRWCQGVIFPKGDEDVDELYREVMEIISNSDDIQFSNQLEYAKKRVGDRGKRYNIYESDIAKWVERTRTNPEALKHFL
jgi:hypothetical protein